MAHAAVSVGASQAQAVEILNQALRLEYSLIIYCPRIASRIRQAQTRQKALELCSASIRHADIVAKAISKMGRNPNWTFETFPEGSDLVTIFQKQLEREKTALNLHRQASEVIPDLSLRETFKKLAKEEETHIQMVTSIISDLG